MNQPNILIMINTIHYFALAFIVLILFACVNDGTKSTKQNIQGKWELYAAERDGKNIATLEGTYFHFMGDTLVSNFPIVPTTPYTVPIKITANSITNLDQNVVFMLEPNDYTDTLHLSTTVRDNGFDLMLQRVEEE